MTGGISNDKGGVSIAFVNTGLSNRGAIVATTVVVMVFLLLFGEWSRATERSRGLNLSHSWSGARSLVEDRSLAEDRSLTLLGSRYTGRERSVWRERWEPWWLPSFFLPVSHESWSGSPRPSHRWRTLRSENVCTYGPPLP